MSGSELERKTGCIKQRKVLIQGEMERGGDERS